MPIEGFDYKAFANDLASQAMQILMEQSAAAPDTLTDNDKKTITDTLRQYCLMAGEALDNDEQIKLTAEQAILITQFIGEWTFHKSIDLINSKIPVENREPILQAIAANIFNSAKLAIIKNLPQDRIITLIEAKVKQVYDAEIDKLLKRGILTPEQAKNAENQSNLNNMIEKTQEAEQLQEAQSAAKNHQSDNKSLKFVALAVVLKRLSEEQVKHILNAFNAEDSKHILNYMKMSNIEKKVDSAIILKTLMEIKKLIPVSSTVNVSSVLKKFYRDVKSAEPKVLSNIAINERENVRDFILDLNFPVTEIFSPHVIKSVAKTIEDKIHDY